MRWGGGGYGASYVSALVSVASALGGAIRCNSPLHPRWGSSRQGGGTAISATPCPARPMRVPAAPCGTGVDGGGGRIRTLGDLRHAGFQNRCIRPLCHASSVPRPYPRPGPIATGRRGDAAVGDGRPGCAGQAYEEARRPSASRAASSFNSLLWLQRNSRPRTSPPRWASCRRMATRPF